MSAATAIGAAPSMPIWSEVDIGTLERLRRWDQSLISTLRWAMLDHERDHLAILGPQSMGHTSRPAHLLGCMQLGRPAAHAGYAVALQANYVDIDIGGVL